MKIQFKLSTILSVFILLVLTQTLSLSCKKVSKEAAKKAAKVITTTILVLAVEELAGETLMEQFKEAPEDKQPINVIIHNNYEQKVKVDLSNDGNFWEARLIEPKQKTSYTSKNKGIIGAKTGDSYYMLRKSQEYKVVEKSGKFIIEEIKVEN